MKEKKILKVLSNQDDETEIISNNPNLDVMIKGKPYKILKATSRMTPTKLLNLLEKTEYLAKNEGGIICKDDKKWKKTAFHLKKSGFVLSEQGIQKNLLKVNVGIPSQR